MRGPPGVRFDDAILLLLGFGWCKTQLGSTRRVNFFF